VNSRSFKRFGMAAGLVASGAVAGGILAATLSANADQRTADAGSSTSQSTGDRSHRGDEELLTGDTKSQVEEAVLAEYPGATIQRTETDSDGVYESHIVTANGEELIVQVGEDFSVTGTQSDRGPRGDRDGNDRN
jgi:hypothetical protein